MDSCLSSPATLPILNQSLPPTALQSLGNFSKTTPEEDAAADRRCRIATAAAEAVTRATPQTCGS